MSLRLTVIVALVAAGLSFALPLGVARAGYGGVLNFCLILILSAAWLVTSIYAIARYRKRGAWTFLGLLPVLFWAFYSYGIYCLPIGLGATSGHACGP